MNKYYQNIANILEKASAYKSVMNLLDYDSQVNAPSESSKASAKIAGHIADEYRNLFVHPKTGRTLYMCYLLGSDKLSPKERIMLKEALRLRKKMLPISGEDYRQYTELTSNAVNLWSKCKQTEDYDSFAPVLGQIIAYNRKFAESRCSNSRSNTSNNYHINKYSNIHGNSREKMSEYDVLLSDYEPDITSDVMDDIVNTVKRELLPVAKKYVEKNTPNDNSAKKNEEKNNEEKYNEEINIEGKNIKGKKIEEKHTQKAPSWLELTDNDRNNLKEFCEYISRYIGFDPDRGVIGESAHPFTLGIHNKDVRLTNNYNGDNFIYPIFSSLHETGHALYELGISDRFTMTILGEGTSEGMHESISRFYENMIGRKRAFWKPLYPRLVSMFPDKLDDVTLEEFMKTINRVTPGAVRTCADELTYPFHIIIRYELEKELISGRLSVKDLPEQWNKLYKQYLGIEPSAPSTGVLQDIHWAMGNFGYFPSYLIGSAVAAQIYYHLCDIMPYDSYLEDGNISAINDYLKKHVFRYGKSVRMNTILKHMTGEELNINYYIKYLKSKYAIN